jgi:hypothetical protein
MLQETRSLSGRARSALAREAREERGRRTEERLKRRLGAWYRLMARRHLVAVQSAAARRGLECDADDELLNWLDQRFDLTMQTIAHQARQRVAQQRQAVSVTVLVMAAV